VRVLFATHAPRDATTAVFRHYVERSEWLRSAGHEAGILSAEDVSPRSEGSRWKPIVYPLRLRRRLREIEPIPDVVVGHSFSLWPAVSGRGRSRRGREPAFVTDFHGLEPLYYRYCRDEPETARSLSWRYRVFAERLLPILLKRACAGSAAVTCMNREEQRFLVESGWARSEAVHLIPGVVDASFFVDRAIPVRATGLLFLGQWLRAKGTLELTRAFEALAVRHPDLSLTCLGTRVPEAEVLGDFSAELRSRVRVVPAAGRTAVVSELARADIFVFPSHYEGFGLALLEAMAAALPIVCTSAGIAADTLVDGRDALLVPRSDPGAIASAVEALLDDSSRRQELGRRASEIAGTYRVEAGRRRYVEFIERCGGTS
jgi:glycosyltransferase involved in cell wall biosynthesis